MASMIFEERVAVPLGLTSLADFRQWSASPGFPATGRIDFLAGTMAATAADRYRSPRQNMRPSPELT